MKLKALLVIVLLLLTGCNKSQGQVDVHRIEGSNAWSAWVTVGDRVILNECIGAECKP